MKSNVMLKVNERLQLEISAPDVPPLTVQLSRLSAQILAARLKNLSGGEIGQKGSSLATDFRGTAFGTKVEPKPRSVRPISLK